MIASFRPSSCKQAQRDQLDCRPTLACLIKYVYKGSREGILKRVPHPATTERLENDFSRFNPSLTQIPSVLILITTGQAHALRQRTRNWSLSVEVYQVNQFHGDFVVDGDA